MLPWNWHNLNYHLHLCKAIKQWSWTFDTAMLCKSVVQFNHIHFHPSNNTQSWPTMRFSYPMTPTGQPIPIPQVCLQSLQQSHPSYSPLTVVLRLRWYPVRQSPSNRHGKAVVDPSPSRKRPELSCTSPGRWRKIQHVMFGERDHRQINLSRSNVIQIGFEGYLWIIAQEWITVVVHIIPYHLAFQLNCMRPPFP